MKPLSLAGLSVAFALCANAQEFGLYLSSSFNQSTGDAYAFAETTADYSTGYYYTVCTAIIATGQRDGYNPNQWDSYISSSTLTCDYTDAEVSWPFSVPTDTIYIGFYGQHYEYVDYYVYQFDPYCWLDCDLSWDAYGFSLLGVGDGTLHGYGTYFYLPGPPEARIITAIFFQQTFREEGVFCLYPWLEFSTYEDKSDPQTGLYIALFKGHLANPFGNLDYSGRTVEEGLDITSETCDALFPGGPNGPVTTGSFALDSSWSVSSIGVYGDGDPEYDGLGGSVYDLSFYQARGVCNRWTGTQSMSISSCQSPATMHLYDPGHIFKFDIGTSSMTATRGLKADLTPASGAAQ